MQNGKAFVWSAEAEAAFQDLKKALTTTPILGYPMPEGHFTLDTDAGRVCNWGSIVTRAEWL